MRKRSLRINLEKEPKNPEITDDDDVVMERIVYVHEATKDITTEFCKIMALYVALDTARKVMITLAAK